MRASYPGHTPLGLILIPIKPEPSGIGNVGSPLKGRGRSGTVEGLRPIDE
jgi:hypothetical protein